MADSLYNVAIDSFETAHSSALDEWGSKSLETVPVIDLRLSSTACIRRLRGSVHMDASSWADHCPEMPPRRTRFAVLHDAAPECTAVLQQLKHGFSEDLAAVFLDDESFWAKIPAEQVIVGDYPLSQQPRLWRPSPLAQLLIERWSEWSPLPTTAAHSSSGPRVFDAGCGQGRNAVYVLGSLPGSSVLGVDNRRAMVEKAAKFAGRHGYGAAAVNAGSAEGSTDSSASSSASSSSTSCGPLSSFTGLQADVERCIADSYTRLHGVAGDGADATAEPSTSSCGKEKCSEEGAPDSKRRREAASSSSCGPLLAGGASSTSPSNPAATSVSPAPAPSYDVVMFMRSTFKRSIAAAPIGLLDPVTGGLLVVEAFHTSTPHPSDREHQFGEGELIELLGYGPAPASAAAAAAAAEASPVTAGGQSGGASDTIAERTAKGATAKGGKAAKGGKPASCKKPPAEAAPLCPSPASLGWSCTILHEAVAPAEDGRPLLQVVARLSPPKSC